MSETGSFGSSDALHGFAALACVPVPPFRPPPALLPLFLPLLSSSPSFLSFLAVVRFPFLLLLSVLSVRRSVCPSVCPSVGVSVARSVRLGPVPLPALRPLGFRLPVLASSLFARRRSSPPAAMPAAGSAVSADAMLRLLVLGAFCAAPPDSAGRRPSDRPRRRGGGRRASRSNEDAAAAADAPQQAGSEGGADFGEEGRERMDEPRVSSAPNVYVPVVSVS